jgi:hypothetical protein
MSTELEVQNQAGEALQTAMEPAAIKNQINLIQKVMKEVMVQDEHFGVIPGCGKKPALLKPGAEKLSLLFQLRPTFTTERREYSGGHREYEVVCTLTHIPSETVRSQGLGCCTTLEGKYRYRSAEGEITDKEVPKAYWDLKRQDFRAALQMIGGPGHGTKKDPETGQWMITVTAGEKVEHDNPADYYNTCLKMAKKRAYIDATLSATAASDIFIQDLDEVEPEEPIHHELPQEPVAPTPPGGQQKSLYNQAWDLFNSVKNNLTPEICNWCMDEINAHRYDRVIRYLNGEQV